MQIRKASLADAPQIARLFWQTIRQINSRDYSASQVEVWAGTVPDPDRWAARQATRITFVAEEQGEILGFAELDPAGMVDAFYVHARHQRCGTGSALWKAIENEALMRQIPALETDASITARPFFSRHGFELVRVQQVNYLGTTFENFRMRRVILDPCKSPDGC